VAENKHRKTLEVNLSGVVEWFVVAASCPARSASNHRALCGRAKTSESLGLIDPSGHFQAAAEQPPASPASNP
jgi:hypothetical protein